jgi:subtilisin family serine protease
MFHKMGRIFTILLLWSLVLSLSLGVTQSQGGIKEADIPVVLESKYIDSGQKDPQAGIPSGAQLAGQTGISGLKPVSIIVTFDKSVSAGDLARVSGGRVIHRYKKIFNGASLIVSEDKLGAVDSLKGVTRIYLDKLLQPDTERSPTFIGAPVIWDELGGQGTAGEGVIVGVLDTGIWPEHPSYSDPDPFGHSYPAPPTLPGSNGIVGPDDTCDFGNIAFNPNDAPFTCNNKLIGAYDFTETYKAIIGLLLEEFDSARDADGHGTHTSSTAAGNGGVAASIFGIPRGSISGVAPRAHVIMYKVCGDQGCFASDSAAAVEQAILDEVDALNFSIGGGSDPYNDLVSLAFLSAYDNGVFVAASAGNSGPGADTTDHREPWTTTVGASTSDRHFISTISLPGRVSASRSGTMFTPLRTRHLQRRDRHLPVRDAAACGQELQRSRRRRRWDVPVPSCVPGCVDRQPLHSQRVSRGRGTAELRGHPHGRDGHLHPGSRHHGSGRRRDGFQLARWPGADPGHQQARHHRPRPADPGRSHAVAGHGE